MNETAPPKTAVFWETPTGWATVGDRRLRDHMYRCPRRAVYVLKEILPEVEWDELHREKP